MAKVYLDPGHGGHDPGAVDNGLKEKDVVLKIAKYTRGYLQNNYENVFIRMSRTSDKFVSLANRTSYANKWGADRKYQECLKTFLTVDKRRLIFMC